MQKTPKMHPIIYKTMKFGLIGHPITHSLSPALFKAGYDGRYTYDLIETADFEEAYERFLKDYEGINVTAPFKELAARKADILSLECKKIGAANILVKTPEGIKAYNSDYLGVRQWLSEVAEGLKRTPHTDTHRNNKALQRRDTRVSKMFEEHRSCDGTRHCAAMSACPILLPQAATLQKPTGLFADRLRPLQSDWGLNIGPTILIVGLGGAGKAAAEAAKSLGFRTILMNRTRFSEEIRPLDEFCKCFREADIIIYNIPMAVPQLTELTDDDFRGGTVAGTETAGICRPKVILEANYKNPSFNNALNDRMIAVNPHARYVSGETWLLYQALTGYEIFTGKKPDLVKMSAVI